MITAATYPIQYNKTKTVLFNFNKTPLQKLISVYIIINQQDAAVLSQFYFTAGSLYMFRVLSTPVIRST